MYFAARNAGNPGSTLNGTTAANWGETRYYTEEEWGTAGSHITGAVIQTLGTAIGTRYTFALSHTTLTSYSDGGVYSMSWYQPTYASTYENDALRRYNGG